MSEAWKDLDPEELLQAADRYRRQLEQIKADNTPEDFTWYGFDSFGNFKHLSNLLTGDMSDLMSRIDGPLADIGAADGDTAFFLESLGLETHIIDNAPTNWNGLRGAYRLRELLGSSVRIHEVDLDEPFELPVAHYDMVFFLGLLYHLKNPYLVLERLARHSRWMYLSTRIARQTGDPRREIGDIPVAYLLTPEECNNDATNYWIFSRAGLERILQRTGWQVRRMITAGDTETSNPSDTDHDERAYVVAESVHATAQ